MFEDLKMLRSTKSVMVNMEGYGSIKWIRGQHGGLGGQHGGLGVNMVG
jgi:hypothetical protein